MNGLEEFYEKYPLREITLIGGKTFAFRYYKKPGRKATIVLLTGGIGLSDLFYLHFERFARDFSVLTYDYQIRFENNAEFAKSVAELLKGLDERIWLVGQSLGGIAAQIIARNYPEIVCGLVLSNTCSLSGNMDTVSEYIVKGAVGNEI